MTIKERFEGIIGYFTEHRPDAKTELHYSNPYELLVAVILSAQCTDKRVNQVTPRLFARFPGPESLAKAHSEEVLEFVKTCSYPNNKSSNLVKMARMLVNDYQGSLPSTVEELQKLPGVGRKTANVIAAVIFDQPAMPVDTHVFRVSNRIGLAKGKTPLDVEKQLVRHFPPEILPLAHHWLILHGRYTCKARKPDCDQCGITRWCLFFANQKKST
jgi:endonuclease III